MVLPAPVETGQPLSARLLDFGRPRGEDDLARLGADQVGDLPAGGFDRRLGLPPEGVALGMGIAELSVK